MLDSAERWREERGPARGSSARRAHGNNFETPQCVWNRKCWGGAYAGWLRAGAAPRRAPAGGAALCLALGRLVSRLAAGPRRYLRRALMSGVGGGPCAELFKVSSFLGVGTRGWASSRGAERPPSFRPPVEPGLAVESPRAGGRKRKVKERRPGATMGAPRGCRERPCAQLLPGRRGRTKAATAGSPLWGRAGGPGRRDAVPRGFIAALGLEGLRVWRSWASARRLGPIAGPGSVSAVGGSATF